MKVDVRLCGAIPRSEWNRECPGARLTSALPSYLAATNALANAPTGIGSKNDTTIDNTSSCCNSNSHESTVTLAPSCCSNINNISQITLPISDNNSNNTSCSSTTTDAIALMPLLEPPSWAVPASGEARLEPVCEALGMHVAVDLTERSFYRIGRSPASDVQLLHGTSSRRHAMIFHHPNGSCYIVDCGSAHGTFVNGHRIITKTTGGWVVPHKVRRGSLIRFGGPGAPAFVLKSFAIGFSAMVSLDEEDGDDEEVKGETKPLTPRVKKTGPLGSRWQVQFNTRLNALGRSPTSTTSGALTETSGNIMKAKRTVLSLSTSSTSCCNMQNNDKDYSEPCPKRQRCMSPPISPEAPIRLVSPDSSTSVLLNKHHHHHHNTVLLHHDRRHSSTTKRVHFCEDAVQPFYPALVSPEELSDNEDAPITTTLCPSSTSSSSLLL